MAYATSTNVTDRLGSNALIEAADRDANGTADATAVSLALDDASSEIDSYLGSRYSVPIASSVVPPWLVRCCVDLAIYHLASENRGSLADEHVKKYERWIKRLEQIADPSHPASLGMGDDELASHYDDALNSETAVMLPEHTERLF